ncbi:MAG: hypothetical protein ACOY94_20475 [Bacillota bacterium]
MEERFWDLAGELVVSSEVLARTTAMDGGGIDVWVGSLAERRITGMLILRP